MDSFFHIINIIGTILMKFCIALMYIFDLGSRQVHSIFIYIYIIFHRVMALDLCKKLSFPSMVIVNGYFISSPEPLAYSIDMIRCRPSSVHTLQRS